MPPGSAAAVRRAAARLRLRLGGEPRVRGRRLASGASAEAISAEPSFWAQLPRAAPQPSAEPAGPRRAPPPPQPLPSLSGRAVADVPAPARPRQEPDPDFDKPPYPPRLVHREADLPWPYVETPNSVQIVDAGSRQQWPTYWKPRKAAMSGAEEEDNHGIRVNFHWEEDPNPVSCLPAESPYGSSTVNYHNAFVFRDGHKLVERACDEFGFKGSGSYRSVTAKEVTVRTRERILGPGCTAYLEMHLTHSCLHFGFGLVEAQRFNPYAWLGHHVGSWSWFEDGRIGGLNNYELGRVFKTWDNVGVIFYQPPPGREARSSGSADPQRPDAKLLFLRNGEPAGDVITIPHNEAGWYFATTMISHHGSFARASISPRPKGAQKALEHLGKIVFPDDADFADSDSNWQREVYQPYCPNRWNPYHVCGSKCRTPQAHMVADNDPNGRPTLAMPSVRSPWKYFRKGNMFQDVSPEAHGVWNWTASMGGSDHGRVWAKPAKPDRHMGRNGQKWPSHCTGAMSGL
eukprot:TRINITY_DN47294_c0_g1_i1.p1 TRINITY_DN47294_c0_g1~~TRINITY_DN47294_c0_g1_i1.p1  ORF type:complete len:538 (+),score=123.55 TRINITY_DN47294_c0_g1_i1:68-1615(+)